MKRAYIQPKLAERKSLLQTVIAQSPTVPVNPSDPPVNPGDIDSKERGDSWDDKGLW